MSSDIIIPGVNGDSIFFPHHDHSGGFGPWNSTELLTVRDFFLENFEKGPLYTPHIQDLLIKGINHPSTMPEVLANLLVPQCSGSLDHVLDNTSLLKMNSGLKIGLQCVSTQADLDIRIRMLGILVIARMRSAADATTEGMDPRHSSPLVARVPNIEQLEQQPVYPNIQSYGDGVPPDTVQLWMQLVEGHDIPTLLMELGKVDDPVSLLLSPDVRQSDSIRILTAMASFPELDGYSLDATTALQTILEGHPGESANTGIESDIASLVQQLGSENPAVGYEAMQALHDKGGTEVIQALQMAKADQNLQEPADQCLRWIFTNVSPIDNLVDAPSINMVSGDNPLRLSDLDNRALLDNTSEILPATLDVEYYAERLGNPETSISALNSLVQIGMPALPALCEILARVK